MGLHLTGNSPQAVYDRARQASMSEPGFTSRDDMLQAARSMEAQEQEMVRQWQEKQARMQQQQTMAQPQPLPGTQTTLDQFNQQGMM
jgi:phosphoglycolate phosphatase-like HAD superfamily hydrolase